MKRLIAILLLLGFISSTTELHELLKLPHLVYHFFEHRSEKPGISLLAYFHEHYAHDHQNHKDEHHDKGCLPFQGEHTCQVITSLGVYEAPASLKFILNSCLAEVRIPSADSPSSDFLSKIWQPPKI